MLGSRDPLIIEVTVINHGEDAFEAGFYMTIPAGLHYRRIDKLGSAQDSIITCTAPSAATNNTLKCDIGNPLAAGKSVCI